MKVTGDSVSIGRFERAVIETGIAGGFHVYYEYLLNGEWHRHKEPSARLGAEEITVTKNNDVY